MKKFLKTIGKIIITIIIIILVLILGLICWYLYKDNKPSIKENYRSRIETGGNIEQLYVSGSADWIGAIA